jgi:uncharacterized membrane protein YhaH (DUF805 family)
MHWMILPFKRYADFSGRSQRQEFWLFFLFNWMIALPLFIFVGRQSEAADKAKQAGVIDSSADTLVSGGVAALMLYIVAIIVPSIAVVVRRLHDQDKSGWLALLTFIPYVGSLVLVWFMATDGTAGPNRYGDDPKGRFLENQDWGDIEHYSTVDYSKDTAKPPARIVS